MKSCASPWVVARWAAIGFLSGVFLHAFRPFDPMSFWIPCGIVIVAIVAWSHNRLVAIVLFSCAVGFLRFDLTLPRPSDALASRLGETIVMTGTVENIRTYDALLRIRTVNGVSARSASVVSFPSKGKYPAIGEMWKASCRIEKNEKAEPRFQIWEARNGVFFRCKGSTELSRISSASPYAIPSVLRALRATASKRVSRLFSGDAGALLSGILYGERGLSDEASTAFRSAGMTHLIAVSGSNIAIVVGLFVPIFLFLGYRRKTAIVFSGACIFLFAFFVGAGASVLRAALMGWFAILARVFGRRANATHLLLIVGAMMALADPWAPGFDAGFALSFLATWALLAWSNPIARTLRFLPETFGLREIISTTLAATLVTAPYSLWAFGSVSVAGLVTNLFAIPLTAFAMGWGAFAFIFGDVSSIFLLPAKGCLDLLLWIADQSLRFPFLILSFPFSLVYMVFIYIFLLYAWIRLDQRSFPQILQVSSKKSAHFQAIVREDPTVFDEYR